MYTIKTKNLILGGGASGLSLAKYLGPDTVILSKDQGGLLNSFKSGQFTFDYGGHVYTANDPDVSALMRQSEGNFFEERKAYYLADGTIDGNMVPFPVQNSGLFKIETKRGAVSAHDQSLEDWALDMFGKEFCDGFFFPFNRRVWGADPYAMSCDWIKSRVAPPSADYKTWGINANFWYAPGAKLVSRLCDESPAFFIKGKVKNIDSENKRVQFDATEYYADKGHVDSTIEYAKLFVTIPTFKTYPSYGMLAIGIGLNSKLPYDFHWLYPHVSSRVHRVTLLSRYHESLAPEGQDSLLLEIPMRKAPSYSLINPNFIRENLKEIAAHFAQDAGFSFGPSLIETVFYHYEERSMPVPALTLINRVAVNKHIGESSDIYYAGRWGSHGYWNLQDILKDAEVTAGYATTRSESCKDDYFLSLFYYG